MVAQGDVVTTVIRCARGEVVTLVHDTNPAPALFRQRQGPGHKGPVDGGQGGQQQPRRHLHDLPGRGQPGRNSGSPSPPYAEDPRYNPLWHWYKTEGIRGGHGGMDYLVLRAFVESVLEDKAPPIDVYDAAPPGWR